MAIIFFKQPAFERVLSAPTHVDMKCRNIERIIDAVRAVAAV